MGIKSLYNGLALEQDEKGQIEGYLANEEGKTVGRTVIKKRKR